MRRASAGERGEGRAVVYWLAWAVARLGMRTQLRLRVEGAKQAPRRGALLIVSNHLGPSDPLVIGLRLRRQMHIVAKAELFSVPVFGWFIGRAGVVPIRRDSSDREGLRAVARLLASGRSALVFPEGTYNHAPAAPGMLPLRSGAAWLALRTGATVLPVGIWGAEHVWVPARGWRLGKRPPVRVRFGEPYSPTLPPGMPMKPALEALTRDMALRIASLLPAEYRGVYAEAVEDQARVMGAVSLDAPVAGP